MQDIWYLDHCVTIDITSANFFMISILWKIGLPTKGEWVGAIITMNLGRENLVLEH